MKSKTKTMLYIIISIIVIFIFVKISINNRRKKELILRNGEDTIGVVVNRKVGRNNGGSPVVSVSFDFYVENALVKHLSQYVSDEEYYQSIIGMKYKVKYLEDRPHVNSLILLNEPIPTEYVNIEKERQRIRETYKNANVFLKKNARPLEKIQYLIP